MQLTFRRRFFLFVSGASLVSGGVLAIACSTDNGTTQSQPTVDGGRDSNTPTNEAGTDGSSDSSTSADCSAAPKIRNNENGFYCSFLFRDGGPDGGGGPFCTNDETCCNPTSFSDGGFPPTFCADGKGGANDSYCASKAAENDSAWPTGGKFTGTSYGCADSRNCGGGQKCCMFTQADAGMDKVNIGTNLDENIPKACDAKQAFKQGGTYCAASCAAGTEIPLCHQDSECTGNTKCLPFEAFSNRDLASCR